MPHTVPLELAVAAEGLFTGNGASALPNDGHARHVYARQLETLEAALRARLKLSAPGPVAIIYDVEGTTTPLPFVTKVLYPYSEQRVVHFVNSTLTDEVLSRARANKLDHATPRKQHRHSDAQAATDFTGDADVIDAIAREVLTALQDAGHGDSGEEQGLDRIRQRIAKLMLDGIAANSKATYLKLAQGLIWRRGYCDGTIRGHLFDDAALAMSQLGRRAGVYQATHSVSQHIYSSGSIPAQKLLFAYSTHGDLTPCLAGYHDPAAVGPKTHATSYDNLKRRIAATVLPTIPESSAASPTYPVHVDVPPVGTAPTGIELQLKGFIFVTDSLAELKAANEAGGIIGVLSVRPMNAPLPAVRGGDFAAALGGEAASRELVSIVTFAQLTQALGRVLLHCADEAQLCGNIEGEVATYRSDAPAALKAFN
jgi:2,3-diketo-5-methylthio-1-phosphopentane phosphatase